jgi:hypothetical protein
MNINITLRTLVKIRKFVYNHENLVINTLATMTVVTTICTCALIIGLF